MIDDHDLPPAVQINVHPGLCQGWGECHRWAPHVYPLDAEGRIDIDRMEVPGESADDAFWGASACPTRAITLIGPPEPYWFDRLRRRNDRERRSRQTS
jgi:ferredoxin